MNAQELERDLDRLAHAGATPALPAGLKRALARRRWSRRAQRVGTLSAAIAVGVLVWSQVRTDPLPPVRVALADESLVLTRQFLRTGDLLVGARDGAGASPSLHARSAIDLD